MEQKNQMQIAISPEVANGRYANLAIIGHTASEFVIDFAAHLPGQPNANVVSRVILTPEHAKSLLAALKENVQKYEANFGTIMQKQQAGVPLSFGGGEA